MKFILVTLILTIFSCTTSKTEILKKTTIEEKKLFDAVSVFSNNNPDLALQKLLSIDADNYKNAYEVYNYIGVIYFKKNDLNNAEQYFKKSINRLYDFEDSHNNLAYIYMLKSRYTLAREEFLASLRINPNYEQAQKNLELLDQIVSNKIQYSTIEMFQEAEKESDYDKKIKAYKDLLKVKPNMLELKNNLAVAYFRKGNIEKSKKLLTEVLSNNPKYYEAHNNIAYILLKEKNYDRAIPHFLTSIRIKATYTIALLNLGDLFFEKKDYTNSKKVWLKVLTVEPSNRYVEERLKKISEMGI